MVYVRFFIVILVEEYYFKDKIVFYIVILKWYNWNIGKIGIEKVLIRLLLGKEELNCFWVLKLKRNIKEFLCLWELVNIIKLIF